MTKIKEHIISPAHIGEDDFAVVEALLLNLGEITISTAKEMLALIRLAAYIPRPYIGRTAALVKTIYSVDQISRQDRNNTLSGHRHKLKLWVFVVFTQSINLNSRKCGVRAMKSSHQELTSIKEAPYEFQEFSLDSSDYKSRRDSVRKIFSEMEIFFTTFAVSPANFFFLR